MATSRSRFRRLTALGCGVSILVTACGGSGSTGGSGSASGPTSSGPGQGSGAPTASPPTPTGSSTPGAQIEVSGVLIEGLRPTCRVLRTDTRRYALVGPGTRDLKEGDHVTVTGTERPDLRNPCGLTLVVSAIA